MAAALEGPIPGSASSSAADATFMFTASEAGVAVLGVPVGFGPFFGRLVRLVAVAGVPVFPLEETLNFRPLLVTVMVPSRSVRCTFTPADASLSSAWGSGWPYRLSRPALIRPT